MRLAPLSAVLSLALLAGCERGVGSAPPAPAPPVSSVTVNGVPIHAPAGSAIEYRHTTDGGLSIDRREASGQGAGLSTNAPEVAGEFNATAPGSSLDGATASGGATAWDIDLGGAQGSALLWIGAALLLIAGVCLYLRLTRAALIVGGVGGALIVAGLYPGVALFVGVGGAGVLLAVYLWAERSGQGYREAVRALVAGVEELPNGDRQFVKGKVDAHADERDRATIRKVKRGDGYGSERPGVGA